MISLPINKFSFIVRAFKKSELTSVELNFDLGWGESNVSVEVSVEANGSLGVENFLLTSGAVVVIDTCNFFYPEKLTNLLALKYAAEQKEVKLVICTNYPAVFIHVCS